MTTTIPIHMPRAPRHRAAPPDDRLKDADCMGFAHAFEPAECQRWLDWAAAFRAPDALAETDPHAFEAFRASWRHAQTMGFATTAAPADAWGEYLDALADYHVPGLVIRTLEEHDRMCLRLGSPLRFAPGMPEEIREAAGHFGALDQFYNNLRDMQEDAERGLCWLPEETLLEFGLTREDVISGRAPEMRGWLGFAQFWVWIHWRSIRSRAQEIIECNNMPATIGAMTSWTFRRYDRVHSTLRAVAYDYRRFPAVYWPEAKRELGRVVA